jgi:hypothetical protein
VASLALLLIGLTGMIQVLLFADRVIYGMYGFHINGFVLDLVFTPGRASPRWGQSQHRTDREHWWSSPCWRCRRQPITGRRAAVACQHASARAGCLRAGWVLLAILSFAAGERRRLWLQRRRQLPADPFCQRALPAVSADDLSAELAARLGIKATESILSTDMHIKSSVLSYPLLPLRVEPPARPLNIVWLAVESLRFDLLDPAIMPKLWDFSEQALRLENHYSGGNTTQMGIFSMFYGLYGNYWFPMQAARRSPLLMDVLQQQNYQFSLHTSQSFTYPPFQETVFRENEPGRHACAVRRRPPPWQRDRQNIDDMLRFIDSSRPGETIHDLHVLRGNARQLQFPRPTVSSPGPISKTSTTCPPILLKPDGTDQEPLPQCGAPC